MRNPNTMPAFSPNDQPVHEQPAYSVGYDSPVQSQESGVDVQNIPEKPAQDPEQSRKWGRRVIDAVRNLMKFNRAENPNETIDYSVDNQPLGFNPNTQPPGFNPNVQPLGFNPNTQPPGFNPNNLASEIPVASTPDNYNDNVQSPDSNFNKLSERSPEQWAVGKNAALVEVALKPGFYDENGKIQGIGFQDIITMMAAENPGEDSAQVELRASRLFRRMTTETNNLVVTDENIQNMDEPATYTARISREKVLDYGLTHLRHAVDFSDPTEKEAFERFAESSIDSFFEATKGGIYVDVEAEKQRRFDAIMESSDPAEKYGIMPEAEY